LRLNCAREMVLRNTWNVNWSGEADAGLTVFGRGELFLG
jgi:hypothetical protein